MQVPLDNTNISTSLTSSELPLLTSSYLMAPGLMASIRSITGMLVVMAGSLNPVMLLDLPASERVALVHSTICASLMGLEDPASFWSTERVYARINCHTTAVYMCVCVVCPMGWCKGLIQTLQYYTCLLQIYIYTRSFEWLVTSYLCSGWVCDERYSYSRNQVHLCDNGVWES